MLRIGSLLLLFGLALLAFLSLFTVHQTQQALVLQFGDPRRVITEPGLNVRVPFVQNVVYVDKRILHLDSDAEELIARDQKRLVVDAFTRYRITNPLQFYKSLRDVSRARSRLEAIVSSSMRSIVGEVDFQAVVRDQRAELMLRIRDFVNTQVSDFGVEIVDVRIRRADLPEANSQAIYRRMQTERQQEAAEFRARGQEVSRAIRAQADKQVTVLLAEANRDAEIIRGGGDACRNRIFAAAYGVDPDFFAFYRAMQAYEKALDRKETMLVLSPDSEFLRFLKNPAASLPRKSGAGSSRRGLNIAAMKARGETLSQRFCPDIARARTAEREAAAAEEAATP